MKYPSAFTTLHFGTSGIPPEVKDKGYFGAVGFLSKKRLSAMEMEFVQQVHMDEETALEFGKLAKELGIILSSHAPYYINLASRETEKIHSSINRIVKSAIITHCAGGHSVVFHAGFYQGRKREEVYRMIANGIYAVEKELAKRKVNIWLRPEITGKETQFGSLEELIRLSSEFESVLPCLDFSHLHSRSIGRYNTQEEWQEVIERLRDEVPMGKNILKRMHIHISGIEYGSKGERRHLPLKKSDLEYKLLMAVLKEFNVCGTVICESPTGVLIKDTLALRRCYETIKNK